ncbi:MAG: SDR family oxidoreductase [Woeseiaceae bacterium]|nr:SDR family oxidoreductase [Woeseiaceae bacterium]
MSKPRALITGASAGLGREFARQLAADGKDLVLVARRVEPMEALAEELKNAYGTDVDVIQADLSDRETPVALFDEVQQRGLVVDCLINNAGAAGIDLLRTEDWSTAHDYLELMTSSVVAMCYFFIPPMQQRGYGRVLNVASVAGYVTTPSDYSYGPTKSYLIAFSRGLSGALRKDGIQVTALCPGFTHTDFHASDKLTRMKRSSPKFIWYDADVVVREGLKALEKGRDTYLSGRLYRYIIPLMRLPLSQRLIAALGIKV